MEVTDEINPDMVMFDPEYKSTVGMNEKFKVFN